MVLFGGNTGITSYASDTWEYDGIDWSQRTTTTTPPGRNAAGIAYEPNGITVDRRLRTTNKHVYAIGDVTGAPPFTHLANHHAGLVIRNALFRTPVNADRQAVPAVTFTDPELAQVGLNEDEARAQSGIIRVLRASYRENDRAQATGATNGHIKIITDRRGDILGATVWQRPKISPFGRWP